MYKGNPCKCFKCGTEDPTQVLAEAVAVDGVDEQVCWRCKDEWGFE